MFRIYKIHHPDSGKGSTGTRFYFATERQAREFCGRPESSHRRGGTNKWWFYGYSETLPPSGKFSDSPIADDRREREILADFAEELLRLYDESNWIIPERVKQLRARFSL